MINLLTKHFNNLSYARDPLGYFDIAHEGREDFVVANSFTLFAKQNPLQIRVDIFEIDNADCA